MASIVQLPTAAHAPAAVMAILSRFDRSHLAAFMEVAVELLDVMDAPDDPEEPDFTSRSDGLPGDPADHEPTGDEEAGAYAEWHTKTPAQRRATAELGPDGGHLGFGLHEDHEEDDPREDDDPSGQSDEDGVNTGSGAYMPHGTSYAGPGCPISDDDCSYY